MKTVGLMYTIFYDRINPRRDIQKQNIGQVVENSHRRCALVSNPGHHTKVHNCCSDSLAVWGTAGWFVGGFFSNSKERPYCADVLPFPLYENTAASFHEHPVLALQLLAATQSACPISKLCDCADFPEVSGFTAQHPTLQ